MPIVAKACITVDSIVDTLNELLRADPVATNELFRKSVTVNETVCKHPTIQVRWCESPPTGTLRVIGLLNGLFAAGTDRVVVMVESDAGDCILRFAGATLDNGKVVTDL